MMLPIPKNKFAAFLCSAKQATYAAQDDSTKVIAHLRGSHQLEFRQGALFYRDIYFGGVFFVGQETVYYKAKPIWAMSYAGGVVQGVEPSQTPGIYEFLKAALRAIPPEAPYRGPEEFIANDFVYTNRILGKVHRFSGVEVIRFEDRPIYQLHYSGGLLRD